jgi:hypothetical protein
VQEKALRLTSGLKGDCYEEICREGRIRDPKGEETVTGYDPSVQKF